MMIEKRFILAEDSNGLYSIFDTEDKEDEPLIYGARFGTTKIVDLLNEQQATINELKEENKKLIEEWEFSFRTEMAHHRVAEKELKEKIREQQAIIQSLKEENKKLKNIHWY